MPDTLPETPKSESKLPVTIITGFLGSGKTTLLTILRTDLWERRSAYRIEVTTCLSACNRRCVIALAAPNKTLAAQYYVSNDGLIPRQERPDRLKKGILARIPPLPSSIV